MAVTAKAIILNVKGDTVSKLYVGDCLRQLRLIAKRYGQRVDTLFADPPFNIGVNYGFGKGEDNRPIEEYEAWTREWMSLCDAVMKSNASAFVHVGDDAVYGVLSAARHLGWSRVNWIIWHYRFGQHTDGRFINAHAHTLYFCKGKPGDRAWFPDEVLEPSARLRMGDKRVQMSPRKGMRPYLDVWKVDNRDVVYGDNLGRVQGNNAERSPAHPNQLPELYVARALRCSTPVGGYVLDPFTGSGTTPTVARALGMHFVGCERNPDFARSAARRIAKGPVRDVSGVLYSQV